VLTCQIQRKLKREKKFKKIKKEGERIEEK